MKGKTVVITGASGNLGQVVTEHFAALGATVVAVARSAEPAEGVALTVPCDVTSEAEVEGLMARVHDELGGPHVLLNLVGGYASGQKIVDLDLAVWDHMMNMNLKSALLCSKHALKYMLPEGYGRIVSVSSKAAFDLQPGAAAYALAKAGVVGLTQCLAKELRGSGVSAACVVPSVIDTPATRESMPKGDPAKWVKPLEIAETLAWLASESGGAPNGSIIQLYGGM